MKRILKLTAVFIILFSINSRAQIDSLSLNNLIQIAKVYSRGSSAQGDAYAEKIDSLRTPTLNHMCDLYIAINKDRMSLLSDKFLTRPSNEELKLFFVIRKINSNNRSDKPIDNMDVAKEVLASDFDERWLLIDYYSKINHGLSFLFNDADLSKENIDFSRFNLKNKTEEAILFSALCDAFLLRFRVLQMMKNDEKLLEVASRLPKINGKDYYYYKDFDFEDFEWSGYDKENSFKERSIRALYSYLIAHMNAEAELGNEEGLVRKIYVNSIMSQKKYFKYSGNKRDLKKMYKKSGLD